MFGEVALIAAPYVQYVRNKVWGVCKSVLLRISPGLCAWGVGAKYDFFVWSGVYDRCIFRCRWVPTWPNFVVTSQSHMMAMTIFCNLSFIRAIVRQFSAAPGPPSQEWTSRPRFGDLFHGVSVSFASRFVFVVRSILKEVLPGCFVLAPTSFRRNRTI